MLILQLVTRVCASVGINDFFRTYIIYLNKQRQNQPIHISMILIGNFSRHSLVIVSQLKVSDAAITLYWLSKVCGAAAAQCPHPQSGRSPETSLFDAIRMHLLYVYTLQLSIFCSCRFELLYMQTQPFCFWNQGSKQLLILIPNIDRLLGIII